VRFWIGDGALKLLERAVPEGYRTEQKLEELFEIFRECYDRCCLDTTEAYSGIEDCLDSLEGETLAIASNKPVRFLDRILDGLGLKGRFRVVLGGDTLDVRKPDPAIVRHLIERMEGDPSEIWFVGDSAIDVQTGRDAGARTIGCAWGLRGREELRAARCDFLVDDPREIPPIVLDCGS
jgi:phosphoglycolate phosphatase